MEIRDQYHWLSVVSNRPVAAVNTLWYYRNTYPNKSIGQVTLLFTRVSEEHVEWVTQCARNLIADPITPINRVLYNEEKIDAFSDLIKGVIQSAKEKLIIDMSCGKKIHSALLLHQAERAAGKVRHVFYNFLSDHRYMNLPYPAIPPGSVSMIDMLDR